MSLLSFLTSSKVEEIAPSSGGNRSGGGVKKQWNPPSAIVAIRLWKDGSIFPSYAARDKFDLEYKEAVVTKEALKPKEGETEQKYRNNYEFPKGTGNGLDLIDSRHWPQFQGQGGAMLFTAVVPKNAAKVDMFSSVAYDDNGIPKVSVMNQGAATFGESTLLAAVEAVYGVKFNRSAREAKDGMDAVEAITDGIDFIDLAIVESLTEGDVSFDITGTFSKPIIHVPKIITRGEHKGKPDYSRRENVKVYGLVPASMAVPGYKESIEEKVAETTEGTETEA